MRARGRGDFVVSSVIGQTALMHKFAEEWARALEMNGVDYFHAKDHWNKRAEPYHGLSIAKRKELLASLFGHFRKFVEFGISVAINKKEYKDITSEKFRSQFGSPYTMAIQLMMIEIHKDLWKRNRSHEKANILLEEGAHIHQALEVIERSRGRPDSFVNIATKGYGSKRDNPILQAADMLSYGWGEYLLQSRSQMLSGVATGRHLRFPCITWRPDLITELMDGVKGEIERRRYLGMPGLVKGIKPLLKGPDYEAELSSMFPADGDGSKT
jgi:hypothetical protein